MESPTHYELLCVTPNATADEIRASYRRLVRIYHPDVAGAAGAAMTLRLNEAQRVLLDPDLRSRVDRPASHSTPRRPTAPTHGSSGDFTRNFPKPRESYRASTRPNVQRSAAWDALALASIATILFSTAAVFAFVYAAPVTSITPRVVPPIVIALVWMAAGLSRPPRFAFFLLGASMLLWPLAASGVWPFTSLVAASPAWVWALLTASFVSTIVLRIAPPRVTRYRRRSTPRVA